MRSLRTTRSPAFSLATNPFIVCLENDDRIGARSVPRPKPPRSLPFPPSPPTITSVPFGAVASTLAKSPTTNATRYVDMRGEGFSLDDVFPADYIRDSVQRSLENGGLDRYDLVQFHVWEDEWADDDRWANAVDDLKRQGLLGAVGISINRWEPWNGVRTVKSGRIDAVQGGENGAPVAVTGRLQGDIPAIRYFKSDMGVGQRVARHQLVDRPALGDIGF